MKRKTRSWFRDCRSGEALRVSLLPLTATLLASAFFIPFCTAAQELGGSVPVQNIGVRPALLKNVGIDQKLNASVPLDLTFKDETGKTVELSQYFGKKPVILTLVYYNCPDAVHADSRTDLDESLKQIPLDIGKEYSVVTVSIDPTEGTVLAAAKHAMYTGMYGRPGAAEGWHFLTGEESQIKALAAAVGFRYAYDPDSKQFAHASGIMILTPEGKLSRYFYGITFRAARFAARAGGRVDGKDRFARR